MTRAREQQISLSDTPYYHCMGRCVRRAFLCGEDTFSGNNYDHRKQWIVARLKQLSSVFTIDICAYAVMSNHYHTVLRVDVASQTELSDRDVVERWCQLFSGPLLVQRWRKDECLSPAELDSVNAVISLWRHRLGDISWFMRCLNEHIARLANKEDGCKGRFWEGRFKSQALLDEAALLTCMTYVDLNPLRAGLADSPENSDYTSIQERIYHYAQRAHQKVLNKTQQKNIKEQLAYTDLQKDENAEDTIPFAKLLSFIKTNNTQSPECSIPYTRKDYFELLDWTGRAIREDKKGAISEQAPSILNRLGLNEKNWLGNIQYFDLRFKQHIGNIETLNQMAEKLNIGWVQGKRACRGLYGEPGKERVAL